MRKTALGLAAAVFIAATACDSEQPRHRPEAEDTGRRAAVSELLQSPDSRPRQKVKVFDNLAQAYPGRKFTEVRSGAKVRKNRWLSAHSLTAGGEIIGSLLDEKWIQRELVVFDPARRKVVRTLASFSPGRDMLSSVQAEKSVTNGEVVSWVQGTSNGSFFDWSIHLFDLQTGQQRVVARNGTLGDGTNLPVEVASLSVMNGRVWWTAGYGTSEESLGVGVYSALLTGGKAALWRKDTAGLWPVKDGYYAKVRVSRPGADRDDNRIVHLDFTGKEIGSVVGGAVSSFAGNDRLQVWGLPAAEVSGAETSEGSSRFKLVNGSIAELEIGLLLPRVDGRFATWESDNGDRVDQWFFDGGTGSAVKFNAPHSSTGVMVSHGHLVWMTTSKRWNYALRTTTIHVVKLADLE